MECLLPCENKIVRQSQTYQTSEISPILSNEKTCFNYNRQRRTRSDKSVSYKQVRTAVNVAVRKINDIHTRIARCGPHSLTVPNRPFRVLVNGVKPSHFWVLYLKQGTRVEGRVGSYYRLRRVVSRAVTYESWGRLYSKLYSERQSSPSRNSSYLRPMKYLSFYNFYWCQIDTEPTSGPGMRQHPSHYER